MVRIDVLVQCVIGDLLAAVRCHLGEDVLLHIQIVGRRVLGQQFYIGALAYIRSHEERETFAHVYVVRTRVIA